MPENLHIDPADLPRESVIFGRTAAMREVRESIDADSPCGHSCAHSGGNWNRQGAGGEVSPQPFRPTRGAFPKLNCAAAAADVLERELFGYESGSSLGTNTTKAGAVELAEGGTLFLVEIAAMESMLQGKLLELLQKGTYCRVGGAKSRRANVRVICGRKRSWSEP